MIDPSCIASCNRATGMHRVSGSKKFWGWSVACFLALCLIFGVPGASRVAKTPKFCTSVVPLCIVDPTGAAFVEPNTAAVHATIQAALADSACAGSGSVVWVRESENFYNSDLHFGRSTAEKVAAVAVQQ